MPEIVKVSQCCPGRENQFERKPYIRLISVVATLHESAPCTAYELVPYHIPVENERAEICSCGVHHFLLPILIELLAF